MKSSAQLFLIFLATVSFTTQAALVDFDGDGKADLIYRDTGDYQWTQVLIDGSSADLSSFVDGMSIHYSWAFNGAGDFNADGKNDVIIRNSTSGQWYIYNLDGSEIISRGYVAIESAEYIEVQAVADFNNDGYADVLLRNENTGEWRMTLLQNRTIVEEYSPPMSTVQTWYLVGAQDFDGNGSNDILIRNSVSGSWYVYLYENIDITARGYISSMTDDLNYAVRAVADFDGNGTSDVLMQHLNNYDWQLVFMNGRTPSDTSSLSVTASSEWAFNSADDYDGDGKADIVLRNSEGLLKMFFMDGANISSQSDVSGFTLSTEQTVQNLWPNDQTPVSPETYSGEEQSTSNIDAWIINNSTTTDYITASGGGSVLEDVQSAELVTVGSAEYMYVEASGIPKYDITITQEIVDELNSRPRARNDFANGSTTSAVAGQVVTFGEDIGYDSSELNCTDTGGDGYWPPGPACPTDQEKQYYFPVESTETTDDCVTGLGAVGLMVNGTSIYNWGDGMSYDDAGVWYNLAPIAEQYDVDICGGHATTDGDYHHHFYTSCLANLLGDDGSGHSPIYGFSADGYPVYGPYESADTLAVSGWVTRDYGAPTSEGGCGTEGERTCTLVDEYDISAGVNVLSADQQGPDIGETVTSASKNTFEATDGFYFEDYYYGGADPTGAQLDQHNGHDNNDGRGYHYHITLKEVDGELTNAFPFTVGPNYKGELPSNTFSRCSGSGGPP